MPNRILKQSICTSTNINTLSMGAETLFYRLLVQCDDFGQFFANPSILRGLCFPMRLEQVTEVLLTEWLGEIVRAGLVWVYDSEGVSYLQVTKWESHQQMRARRHKFPAPPADAIKSDGMISSDINCNQVISDAKTIQSNPNPIRIQSESNDGADAPTTKRPHKGRVMSDASTTYHALTKIWPNGEQEKAIDGAITSQSLEKWETIVSGWLVRGYSPKNVKGMLEWFRDGIPDFKNGNGHGSKESAGDIGARIIDGMDFSHGK